MISEFREEQEKANFALPLLTLLFGKLMQETTFADAHVTDDDVFEYVCVVVGTV